MKKTILAFSIAFSGLVWAQKTPLREMYHYSGKNDKALVKAKTDLFLLNILASDKFEVKTNSSGDDHLDVNLLMPFSNGKISSRVRYDFLNQGFVVSLSNTKLVSKDGKVTLLNNPSDLNHNKVLESFKGLVFTTYQKEINK
ncbi:hypothetical protein EIH07_03880 [Chryseobacterium taklimakanense]|uniref:hypothetical protein n=1 Tax=Chryseobacterium taklimakanense TaxID=536441 RepID=UPI000F5F22D2|nr:hypothetical protein [Chryseobacterium taklimakanense]AZI22244.1 hypothetical protein EIH07_03880 [Chryseobacterium taklimakanense]